MSNHELSNTMDKSADTPGKPGPSDEQRRIRSFVLRQGRLTQGQARAMQDLMPKFGISTATLIDLPAEFGNRAPVVLEIGIGNGEAMALCAAQDPARNYLGAEVHAPGVGHGLLAIEAANLSNARIFHGDAFSLLTNQLCDASLNQVNIWFPDPWHKARHNKRRMIQPAFVALLIDKLQTGGLIHLATDWEAYAVHMMEVLSAQPGLENSAGSGAYAAKPTWRPNTHFERRGERLGHGVWDLLFVKRPG
jgi:tRNA (guanine-N7-)-methyltransferase